MEKIGLIVPSYGQWDYVLKTVKSFFENTPGDGHKCYVIDDCSPDWNTVDWSKWPIHFKTKEDTKLADIFNIVPEINTNILVHHFNMHSGLTRSWNSGLLLAGKSDYWKTDITICGNSDILFTPGWYRHIIEGLKVYDLVGPVTNAPGRVLHQNVKRFLPNYRVTDNKEYLEKISSSLSQKHKKTVYHIYYINGFFMAAKTKTWWRYPYDKVHVFDHKGKMENTAYELQDRWRKKGRKIGIVPACFIFHYRSVSRGRKGLLGKFGNGAYRDIELEKE